MIPPMSRGREIIEDDLPLAVDAAALGLGQGTEVRPGKPR